MTKLNTSQVSVKTFVHNYFFKLLFRSMLFNLTLEHAPKNI